LKVIFTLYFFKLIVKSKLITTPGKRLFRI
jgi:hypothetical protein